MKSAQPYLKDSLKHSRKTAVLALALSLISGNLLAQQPALEKVAAPIVVGPAQTSTAAIGPWLDPVTHAPFPSHATRSPEAEKSAVNAETTQEDKTVGDGSLHQGLKVHGHWVINVRNPDGTLAEHREFENSLESTGGGFLVGLLSGYFVPGDWMIVLGPQSGNGACTATYEFCGLVRSAATYPAMGYCSNYYCREAHSATPITLEPALPGHTPLCCPAPSPRTRPAPSDPWPR